MTVGGTTPVRSRFVFAFSNDLSKRMKTSGAMLLQKKTAERLIGTASAGVDDSGASYVRIGFIPAEGTFWLLSDRVLRMHRSVAIDLVAILRILVISASKLDGFEPTLRHGATPTALPAVRSVGSLREGVLECSFDGVDIELVREADGLCVLGFPAQVAEDLGERLAQELGRIAAWAD